MGWTAPAAAKATARLTTASVINTTNNSSTRKLRTKSWCGLSCGCRDYLQQPSRPLPSRLLLLLLPAQTNSIQHNPQVRPHPTPTPQLPPKLLAQQQVQAGCRSASAMFQSCCCCMVWHTWQMRSSLSGWVCGLAGGAHTNGRWLGCVCGRRELQQQQAGADMLLRCHACL